MFSVISLGMIEVMTQNFGAYITMANDEICRAVGMVLRWKSGKWKTKGLVK